jgi:hypothetical protein
VPLGVGVEAGNADEAGLHSCEVMDEDEHAVLLFPAWLKRCAL